MYHLIIKVISTIENVKGVIFFIFFFKKISLKKKKTRHTSNRQAKRPTSKRGRWIFATIDGKRGRRGEISGNVAKVNSNRGPISHIVNTEVQIEDMIIETEPVIKSTIL
jgi:hypothetical protein